MALPSRYRTAVCSDGVERHLASPSAYAPPSLLPSLCASVCGRRRAVVVTNGLEARSDSCHGRVRLRDTRGARAPKPTTRGCGEIGIGPWRERESGEVWHVSQEYGAKGTAKITQTAHRHSTNNESAIYVMISFENSIMTGR